MSPGTGRVPKSTSAGVVDAGVVLTRLDRRRRSYREVVALFERSARGAAELHVSVVNLAEVLQHSRAYTVATGVDPCHLRSSMRDVARQAT